MKNCFLLFLFICTLSACFKDPNDNTIEVEGHLTLMPGNYPVAGAKIELINKASECCGGSDFKDKVTTTSDNNGFYKFKHDFAPKAPLFIFTNRYLILNSDPIFNKEGKQIVNRTFYCGAVLYISFVDSSLTGRPDSAVVSGINSLNVSCYRLFDSISVNSPSYQSGSFQNNIGLVSESQNIITCKIYKSGGITTRVDTISPSCGQQSSISYNY